jgi:serine/threonine protein kinase
VWLCDPNEQNNTIFTSLAEAAGQVRPVLQPLATSTSTKKEEDMRPLRYMAPETFECQPQYSEKSDVWSFGVLMWEILDRCASWAPYPEVHDDDAVVAGIVGGSLSLKKPKNSNNKLWKTSKKCRGFHPDDRPTFADIRVVLEDLKRHLLVKLGGTKEGEE